MELLRVSACSACRQLFLSSGTCAGCGHASSSPMLVDPDISTSSTHTPLPQVPAPVGVAPSSLPSVSPLDGPPPSTLRPTIDEVLQHPVATIRHLPSACQRPVARLFEILLVSLLDTPCWESAQRLFTFPKLVLRATRGGKGKGAQNSADILRRLQLFEQNDLALL